ncbi:MAG: TonB family protein [Bacteroidota bacterium]
MTGNHYPTLAEMAFEGRNKAYGAFDFRVKYYRTLLISTVIGMIVLFMAVFIPWLFFYFEPVPLVEAGMMAQVEYFDMSAPPDQELNSLARSLAAPEPEVPQVPVVKDSVAPNEEKRVEDPPEEKKNVENPKVDSLAKHGESGMGSGTGGDAAISSAIDVYPRFPGGDESRLYYLRQHIRYPEAALKNQVQGVVMVLFVVEVDGSVSNVKATQVIGGGCDEEAIRVTKEMPRWDPGKRNGHAVRVMVRMPIVFRMPGGHVIK